MVLYGDKILSLFRMISFFSNGSGGEDREKTLMIGKKSSEMPDK